MNICFVMESFSLGGVEKVSYQLIKSWLSQYPSCNIHMQVLNKTGDLKESFDELSGIKISKLESFWRFKQYCQIHKIDCVVFTKGGLSRYAIVLPKSIKTYAIQHVPINLPQVSALKNKLRILGAAILYRMVDKVVCVSHGIRNNLIETLKLPAERVTTIYNAIIDASTLTLANQLIEYQDYYVFVGRLCYQKGHDMLLQSLALAAKESPDIKVVIIGDGEDKHHFLDHITSLKLEKNIIFHGFSDNPYKFIKNAKALLLPSRWEGLPTVLVEAAFFNTQTISFDCRYGPSELTGKGEYGYLIEQNNIEAFASAILEVEKQNYKRSPDVTQFIGEQASTNYYQFTKSLVAK